MLIGSSPLIPTSDAIQAGNLVYSCLAERCHELLQIIPNQMMYTTAACSNQSQYPPVHSLSLLLVKYKAYISPGYASSHLSFHEQKILGSTSAAGTSFFFKYNRASRLWPREWEGTILIACTCQATCPGAQCMIKSQIKIVSFANEGSVTFTIAPILHISNTHMSNIPQAIQRNSP